MMARPKEAWILAERLDNVGDLALLYQAAYGLRQLAGMQTIRVRQWAPPPADARRMLAQDDIPIVSGKALRSLFPGRRLLIYGGGQAVRGNASPVSMLALLATMASSAVAGGKRAALGIGASELPADGLVSRSWRMVLSTFTMLAVRDRGSLERLRRIVPQRSAKLTDDLAFLPSPLHARLTDGGAGEHVVIAPCSDADEGRVLSPDITARWAELIARQLNVERFVLVCHDPRPEMDLAVAEEIRNSLQSRGHQVRIVASADLNEVLHVYRSSAGVITNRLHAMIFALLARKPAFAVADGNDKVAQFAARFAVPLLPQTADYGGRSRETMEQGLAETAVAYREVALEKAKRGAMLNFLMLRRVLHG